MPRPFWFYPSFLCLVAPSVATGWALLFSREVGTIPGGPEPRWADFAGLFAAVWAVYLADRIHDSVRNARFPDATPFAPRHDWAHHHRKALAGLLVPASLLGLAALFGMQERTLLAGLALAAITTLYFAVFRLTRWHRALPRILPAKEVGVAAVFALGAAIAATAGSPFELPAPLLAGTVCLFLGNCLLIARAEEAWDRTHDPCAYFAEEGQFQALPEGAFFLAILLGAWSLWQDRSASALAVVLGASASAVAGRTVDRLHLHPLADAILLLPWPLLLILAAN